MKVPRRSHCTLRGIGVLAAASLAVTLAGGCSTVPAAGGESGAAETVGDPAPANEGDLGGEAHLSDTGGGVLSAPVESGSSANPHPDESEAMVEDRSSQSPVGRDDAPIDISDEMGERSPAGAYVDAPDEFDREAVPDQSEVQVLCNLAPQYLTELAELGTGEDGLGMPFVVLSLSDHVQVWENLVVHYPEAKEDVQRAKTVLNLWHQALAYEEAGAGVEAEDLYRKAELEISSMGASDLREEVGC